MKLGVNQRGFNTLTRNHKLHGCATHMDLSLLHCLLNFFSENDVFTFSCTTDKSVSENERQIQSFFENVSLGGKYVALVGCKLYNLHYCMQIQKKNYSARIYCSNKHTFEV